MRVVNQPQFVSLGEYRRAVDRYLDQIKNVPGVVSVYLMGGFSAPGLSDIDIIVVVDDSFSGRRSSALNPGGVNDYLFLHGPLVFPRSLAEDVQKIVYASNLQLVSGSRTLRPFESLDGDVRNLLSGIYIIDFLESRFLQYAMVKDAIDKRAWLTRSWSILHSVDILKNIDGLAIRAEEQVLLDDIRHARAAWNSSKCVSDEAFLRAFAASKSLNTSLFIRALCTLYGNVSLESSFVTRIDGRKKMIFSDDYASPLYRSRGMSFGNKSITVFECRVPPAYLAHISNYTGHHDVAWRSPPQRNEALEALMKERFYLVRQHADWLARFARHSGSMAGYTGVESRSRSQVLSGVLGLIARFSF